MPGKKTSKRKVGSYQHTDKVRLQPANATMQPIMVNEGDLQVRGVVVGLMRKYR